MEDYRATITVNEAQAAKLRGLVHHTETKYPIIFDPRSGVNIRPTSGAEVIYVPNGKDYSNLLRFAAMGLFTTVEGKLSDADTMVTGVDVVNGSLVITFNYPVYLSDDIDTISDFIVIEKAEEHGIGLDVSTTVALQSEAIAALTFPLVTATWNNINDEITFEETIYDSGKVIEAEVSGTGTLVSNVYTAPAVGTMSFEFDEGTPANGAIAITLNSNFVAGDTIEVAGETVTFYATDADLVTAADAHGISIETSANGAAQATAIAGMTFAGFVVTNPIAGQVLFTESVFGASTIAIAVVVGTGTLSANTATPATNGDFVGTDSIAVADETITFYETDAALAAANTGTGDPFGISLESYHTIDEFAAEIAAMAFPLFTVTANGPIVTFTEDEFGTGTILEPAITGTGTFADVSFAAGNVAKVVIVLAGTFVAGDSIFVGSQTVRFYATEAEIATATSEVLLDDTAITAETIDDLSTTKQFDFLRTDLSESPDLTITFGVDIVKFLDSNAVGAIAEDPFELTGY